MVARVRAGRRRDLLQDEHAGVRGRRQHPQPGLGRDGQPVRSDAERGRLLGRLGGGAGDGDDAAGDGLGHGRLAADSGGVRWDRRVPAVAGAGADGRAGSSAGRRSRSRGRWRARWRTSACCSGRRPPSTATIRSRRRSTVRRSPQPASVDLGSLRCAVSADLGFAPVDAAYARDVRGEGRCVRRPVPRLRRGGPGLRRGRPLLRGDPGGSVRRPAPGDVPARPEPARPERARQLRAGRRDVAGGLRLGPHGADADLPAGAALLRGVRRPDHADGADLAVPLGAARTWRR